MKMKNFTTVFIGCVNGLSFYKTLKDSSVYLHSECEKFMLVYKRGDSNEDCLLRLRRIIK